ncbi:Bug family tripartite tricarboxylate transporter substrate binding protein [Vreelandella malpeensis]|uniref:Tripartite tricarboxylate transporter substrate binding protein n=1 Tax=Vreelandella malpeensis TaxID=1172368 RepID=A0ABS8DTB8_9GAMM|nr:tripartite tricarboxylate transporter substrate binding protein [Halomonas malpeensis]MCB8889508.1 tripartite tricarboxylate transporter substrate binding protein [Halomonas malpeensis]
MIKKSALALSVAMVASPAWAQWPEKSIELIVAYAAGGGTDVTARVLQPMLERELGQSVVVVNRPGAGGEAGHAALSSAKPDGYTLGILNLPPMLTIPITRDAAFGPGDIMPVAGLVEDPSALSVPASSPFQTLEDLIEFARENPGAVTIGTTGVGTDDHLAMNYLAKAADITLTHVPFAGAGPARTALVGGHVSAAAINLGEAMPSAEEGQVRILAQFGSDVSELAPDVPTVESLGYDVQMISSRGVGLPAGVDPAIVERLSEALANIANDEAFIARNHELYTEVNYMSTQDFTQYIEGLQADYQTMWDESPWQ